MADERGALERMLPDHELGAEHGRGQFGVVWAARHRQLNRPVAVKQLTGPVAATKANASRFRREARILARLDHPHVVTVHDYREDDDLRLLVMELLPGGTLKDRIGSGGGTDTVLAAVLAACCGLHHVHLQGALHRDANVVDGTLLGRFETGGPVLSSPRAAGTRVLEASYDNRLYALDGIVP